MSRDDILLSPATRLALRRELDRLWAQCYTVHKNVYVFQQGLREYLKHTTLLENRSFVSAYLVGLTLPRRLILVGVEYYSFLKPLDVEGDTFVLAESTDVQRLEAYLSSRYASQLLERVYWRKRVLLLAGVPDLITNAGLPSFLFVDREYTEREGWDKWPTNLAMRYTNDKLYINNSAATKAFVSTQIDAVYNRRIQECHKKYFGTATVPAALQNILSQIICKLVALFEKYEASGTAQTMPTRSRGSYLMTDQALCSFNNTRETIVCLLSDLVVLAVLDPSLQYLLRWYLYIDSILTKRLTVVYAATREYIVMNLSWFFYNAFAFQEVLSTVPVLTPKRWSVLTTRYPKLRDLGSTWMDYLLGTVVFAESTGHLMLYVLTFLNPVFLVNYYDASPVVNARSAEQQFSKQLFLYCVEQPNITAFSLFLIQVMFCWSEDRYLRLEPFFDRLVKQFKKFSPVRRQDVCAGLYEFFVKYFQTNIPSLQVVVDHLFTSYQFYQVHYYPHRFCETKHQFPELEKLNKALKLYVQNTFYVDIHLPRYTFTVPAVAKKQPQQPFKFRENQLIAYVLKHDVDGKVDTPLSVFGGVAQYAAAGVRERFDLQITEIAVNEGSTKTFVNAVLTETIQNSVDAIRTSGGSGGSGSAAPRVREEIHIFLKETESVLVYQITDFVGIPLNGLLSLMIPFLSSKKASAEVTGEMGSGFFNTYRESSQVVVHTTRNRQSVLVIDEPVRDPATRRTIDIRKQVYVFPEGRDNQTDIYVVLPKQKNSIENSLLLSNFLYYIHNVFSLIPVRGLLFNGKSIKTSTVPLFETAQFNSLYIENPAVESYLFTKNVPFLPLKEFVERSNLLPSFLQESVGKHLVVNIKHGVFTPVQTRANITLSPENRALLETFIAETVYYALMFKMATSTDEDASSFNQYLDNFTSEASLGQLLPYRFELHEVQDAYRVSIFMMQYTAAKSGGLPGQVHPSFAALIHGAYGVIKDRPLQSLTQEEKDRIAALTDWPVQRKVLFKWLSTKSTIAKPPPATDGGVGGVRFVPPPGVVVAAPPPAAKVPEMPPEYKARLLQFYTAFVTQYWLVGSSIDVTAGAVKLIPGSRGPPSVELEDMKGYVVAYYDPSVHKVAINTVLLNEGQKELPEFLRWVNTRDATTYQRIENNFYFKEYVRCNKTVSTLNHELEHAIRNETHLEGAHDARLEIIPPDKERKRYGFYDAAFRRLQLIIDHNLWFRVMRSLP